MKHKRFLPMAALLAAPFLLGWFHVLSKDAFFAANPHADYTEVRADPEQFRGTVMLLAGQIVELKSDGDVSRLEILCFTRDEADRPAEPDAGCGRFLVDAPLRLDAERFHEGRLVTLAGLVTGEKSGEAPVFALVEIYPWPDPARERYHPRYPYPPGWRCDPWYDPFCDPFYDPFYPYPYRHRPGWHGRFGWGW